jgi:hypothetical protein
MTRLSLAELSKPLSRLLWVSVACWSCFVVERFAFNIFEAGVPYHRLPTMFVWLLLLPFVCYWFVLVRSSLLTSWRRAGRVATFGGVSLALAVSFLYASVAIFWTIASAMGVQWW